jgi:hypothetical protein
MMGDTIIITENEAKPATPDVVVVRPESPATTTKVVTEKTTVTETKHD